MRLRRLAAVIFLLLLLPGCGGRSISHRLVVSSMGVAGGGDGLHDIWAVSEDGKEVRRLTSSASSDRSPCFSPDGRRVYFMSNRGLRWGLWWVPFGE